MCGPVLIGYPFGIGRNCSANKWFNVDCNSSIPYLSAFNNMEVLRAEKRRVTVNTSVIKVDCKNPILHSNISHGKSPFLLSGLNNILVVEGCGGAAIMENRSIVAGCSTTCGNNTISDLNYCFGVGCCNTVIPHDLQSLTLNLTGSTSNGRETCGSALLVDTDSFMNERVSRQFVVEDHTFVPISLSWNHNTTECNNTCGEVMIPYPFGIGKSCSQDNWYNVDCNSSTAYLSAFNNIQVLGVNIESQTVTVNFSKISDCEKPVQNNYSILQSTTPFRLSTFHNLFVVEGCGSAAIMDEYGTVVSGCSTTCDNQTLSNNTNNCNGVGCCQTTLPRHLNSFTMNVTGLESGEGTCASAYLVDTNSFMEGRFSHQFVPVTFKWGYDYDPFHGVSEECKRCEEHGGYCYPDQSGTGCQLPHFYEMSKKSSHNGVILGVSISMGSLFLTMMSYALYKLIKKTKAKRRKQRCFKRNGGLLLKQQEASDIGLVDKTIIFTSDELEKATDHFNENRILGRGAQGTVYKGMLADGRIVAIKKSKLVDESQVEQFINEVVILSQVNHRNVVKLLGCCLETDVPLLVSEFISKGTLYDFIHGETEEFSISLNMRIQIAAEVGGAVSYLHSATSIPIYHRDIKSTNILLDEKYRAKVSDFGTSRLVSIDQTHLTTLVKGTFGYFDPEYFQSSQFTEKSDVYSFGVVLLELLTSEKPISLTRFGENRSLATYFMLAMEEGRGISIFDAIVVKEGSRTELLALANLAMRCLNLNGKSRPTMKEVAMELEGIRLSHVPCTFETSFRHVKQVEDST
ncbi:hypothetical protein LXL04_014237 [Taraxacum kok-saghyz]